jgi:undecaprenyl diphosphate synthase
MRLLRDTLRDEKLDLDKNNVQLMAMGRLTDLPGYVQEELDRTIARLSKNTGLILNLALSYGGRAEIVDACKKLLKEAETGTPQATELDERMFARYLYNVDLPDPDLLIRTSGEYRISNFLLWQLAYTEIHITDVLWPDFRAPDLYRAVQDFQARERRFGLVATRKA